MALLISTDAHTLCMDTSIANSNIIFLRAIKAVNIVFVFITWGMSILICFYARDN